MTDIALSSSSSAQAFAEPRDYLALMKPRVMSLVVFTAIVGMAAAPVDMHPLRALISLLMIALGAGASGALNMAVDADIDAQMKRTRMRPTARGAIAPADAFGFGAVLAMFSVLGLALSANYLAAGLLAFTIVFYAVAYSMWMKRRTDQNIVWGGLAGALPPAIAWAAATGSLSLDPLLLVAIIFVWTPPHFWALALYIAKDYAKVGVPMLPATQGAAVTRRQILVYSIALALLGLAPAVTGLGGLLYLATAAILGLLFVAGAVRLARSTAGDVVDEAKGLYAAGPEARPARDLFAFSILYLFALFAALLVEHGFGGYRTIALPFGWGV